MNSQQLNDRVMNGQIILVGEFRNGRVQSSAALDHSSGEKIQRYEIVYIVECGIAFGSVLIYRRLPADADADKVEIGLLKGRCYAFELDRFDRKRTGAYAHLSYREPELLE